MPESQPKNQKEAVNRMYQKAFEYTHKNPYHHKLAQFDEFVMRDEFSENYRGSWNKDIFKREAPLCLEIGSGYGHFMLEYTEQNPNINFVGMDFRFKRGFNLAKKLSLHPHKNFRYLRARGERIQWIFGENELNRIFYFFPDPWPKKRHHKKRLFQDPFLKAAHQVLKPGGQLLIKTDHQAYAEWIAERIDSQELFTTRLKTFDLRKEHPNHYLTSFQTKFEKIFLQKGISIKAFELISQKQKL